MTEVLIVLISILGGAAVITLIVGAIAIYRGFVLCKLWAWFMVPLFHLPELTIPFAIGISLAIGMFQHSTQNADKGKEYWLTVIASPLVVLFMGWIVKMFI
jgi:hypothetical protein